MRKRALAREPDKRLDLREELAAALDRFDIRSPTTFFFDGEPCGVGNPPPSPGQRGAAGDDLLVKAIQGTLYDRCYTRRSRASAGGGTPAADGDFARRLAAANKGKAQAHPILGFRPRPLRRKIESDPSEPRLIVTVPGEGYRFDGRTSPLVRQSLVGERESSNPVEVTPAHSTFARNSERTRKEWLRSPRWLYFSAMVALLAFLGGSWLYVRTPERAPNATPVIVVPPFDNLTGDPGKDYLGRSLSLEVAALLSAYPGFTVIATSDLSGPGSAGDVSRAVKTAGARYVVRGRLHQLRDSLRVTASLNDVESGAAVWSRVFGGGADALEPQEDLPRRIYDSLAGLRGAVHRNEERIAWQRSGSNLNDYDYYLRGASLYSRFRLSDVLNARAILQQGLDRWPDSSLLRLMLAWTHLWVAMNEPYQDPGPEIDEAWRLAKEALSPPAHSPFEAWLGHWLMAFLYQWHDNDFSRSVTEAHSATDLAPYDASSRSELSWIMANAGHADEAIEWARFALQHDPNGPSRYHANLAWAYLVAGREREGISALREKSSEFPVLCAALHVRLGEVEEARNLVAQYVQAGGKDTVHREDIVPLMEPVGTDYTETLRKAGMPEK